MNPVTIMQGTFVAMMVIARSLGLLNLLGLPRLLLLPLPIGCLALR
ncbi:MAG: hypothetical protein HHJ09_04490 [Glaciimonas sp.]|nr:hypothetical protein [Glaciimonas sp.]